MAGVVHILMGSDTREHVALLKMSYWICDGEIYAYDNREYNDTVFKNWYEYHSRPHRLKGKDFLITPCEHFHITEIEEANWELLEDGTLQHFNRRHVHFMRTFGGLILRSLIIVQRYAKRRILYGHLKARTFSKLSMFSKLSYTALPGDIVDIIISQTIGGNVSSKVAQGQPVTWFETNAFKQIQGAERHFNGVVACND